MNYIPLYNVNNQYYYPLQNFPTTYYSNHYNAFQHYRNANVANIPNSWLRQNGFLTFPGVDHRNQFNPRLLIPPPPKRSKSNHKKHNPEEVKQFYYSHNKNVYQTTQHFHMGHETLEKILAGTYGNYNRRKTTPEQDDFIINCVSHGLLTSQNIVEMFFNRFGTRISHDTITRRLHEANFSFIKPRSVQKLDEDQMSVRLHFANLILNDNADILEYIVFSDESRFCNSPDSLLMWRKKDDFSEITTISYSKTIIRTMAWGAIGLNFKSQLYFHDKGVNTDAYIRCLYDSHVFEDLDQIYGKGKYIFMQDGATCHTADKTIIELITNCRILHGWPPNSPDLNPIEMLWSYMKRRLERMERANSLKELQDQLTQLWDEIPMSTINKLVLSFKYRLEMCKKIGGRTISHLLSANKHDVPENLRQNPPMTLTGPLIDRIYELYKENGNKWTKISRIIESERGIKLSTKLIKFKAKEMERKCNDFKHYHEYYSKFPEELKNYFNDNEKQNLPVNIADDLPHVTISIPRRYDNFNLDLETNLQFEENNSDWTTDDESEESSDTE